MEARVLLVEDDEAIAGMYALALRRAGWTVDIAGDGETALDIARRTRPAAIVLDMALPKANGAQVLQQLRDGAGTASTPVVVLSNADSAAWRRTARRLGARWLVKSRQTPPQLVARLVREIGAPDERRRQPRRLEDVLRLLDAMTFAPGGELPVGLTAVLAARGIDLSEASSLEALRKSVASALEASAPERDRRAGERRRE